MEIQEMSKIINKSERTLRCSLYPAEMELGICDPCIPNIFPLSVLMLRLGVWWSFCSRKIVRASEDLFIEHFLHAEHFVKF